MPAILAAAAIGYLLGSIPFGLVLTWAAGLGDIRQIGSGNIGATNVLRTGNKALAALTLAFDLGKGLAAVLLGALWGPGPALAAAGAVVLGHMFPVWLGFRGGKGVATALGVLRRAGLAGGAACRPGVARDRGGLPLFLAGRAGRRGRRGGARRVPGRSGARSADRRHRANGDRAPP